MFVASIKKNRWLLLMMFAICAVIVLLMSYHASTPDVFRGNSVLVDAYSPDKLVVKGSQVDAEIKSSIPFTLHTNNRTITSIDRTPNLFGIEKYYYAKVKNFTGTWTINQTDPDNIGVLIKATSSTSIEVDRSYTDAYFFGTFIWYPIGIMAFLDIIISLSIIFLRTGK